MPAKVRTLAVVLATATFLLLGSASTAVASATGGPVTIVTQIDFSTLPFHGTFSVVDGASLLGCSEGAFVDHLIAPASHGASAKEKVLTCTAGQASGSSFTVIFEPIGRPGPHGFWEVFTGTGAFANLHGGGDFSVVPTSPTTGMETLTGTVRFVT